MILTAPAMITGRANHDGNVLKGKEVVLPFYSSAVIVRFIDRPTLTAIPKFTAQEYVPAEATAARPAIADKPAEETPKAVDEAPKAAAETPARSVTEEKLASKGI